MEVYRNTALAHMPEPFCRAINNWSKGFLLFSNYLRHMVKMHTALFLVLYVFLISHVSAQNKPALPSTTPLGIKDSIVRRTEPRTAENNKKPVLKRLEYFRDTIRRERRYYTQR
jgi:hypothetical protein